MRENMHRTIWNLTWPNVLSNITIPLLSMTDVAIAGIAGGDVMIGSVSVGSSIFNFLYMNCAFLRMGTTGLTAQAYGAQNRVEAQNIMLRALFLAICLAICILLCREQATSIAVRVMGGSTSVMTMVSEYITVRLWALPAALMLFVINGWFIGMQDARTPLYISIFTNVTNIAVSALLTLKLDFGVKGIAYGTVIAQYVSIIAAICCLGCKYKFTKPLLADIFNVKAIITFTKVNINVLIRSFFISLTYTLFTRNSAHISDTILATNTLLMQLFTLYSYIFDGCTFAAESLSGRFIGQQSGHLLRKSCRMLFLWGCAISICYVVVYYICGRQILSIFNPSAEVLQCAAQSVHYIAIFPLLGFVPFLIDGILFGATRVKPLMHSSIVAFTIFFVTQKYAIPIYGNDGLWMAFLLFTVARGILLLPTIYKFYVNPFLQNKSTHAIKSDIN